MNIDLIIKTLENTNKIDENSVIYENKRAINIFRCKMNIIELIEDGEELFIVSDDGFNASRYEWPGTIEDFCKMKEFFENRRDDELFPILILYILKNFNIGKQYDLK